MANFSLFDLKNLVDKLSTGKTEAELMDNTVTFDLRMLSVYLSCDGNYHTRKDVEGNDIIMIYLKLVLDEEDYDDNVDRI